MTLAERRGSKPALTSDDLPQPDGPKIRPTGKVVSVSRSSIFVFQKRMLSGSPLSFLSRMTSFGPNCFFMSVGRASNVAGSTTKSPPTDADCNREPTLTAWPTGKPPTGTVRIVCSSAPWRMTLADWHAA